MYCNDCPNFLMYLDESGWFVYFPFCKVEDKSLDHYDEDEPVPIPDWCPLQQLNRTKII